MKIKLDVKRWIIIMISALVFAGVLYLNNCVSMNSFEQCVFGVFKLKGGSSSPFIYAVIYMFIAFVIICSLLLLPVVDFGKKVLINFKKKSFQIYPIKWVKLYGIVTFIISVMSILWVVEFFPFITNNILSSTNLFDDYYVDSGDVVITFPQEKRNLIYIFVESLESSNVGIENGGHFEEAIIPNLEALALDNINFSNSDKIGGANSLDSTSWTVAAMIGHTSGVPLKVSLSDLNVNSTRFSNVTSVGDILAVNGYNSYLLLGSDASFGGRRAYFANHNYLIKDYYTAIEEDKIDEDYYEWWGYEDSKLFEYAKELLIDISEDDKPFNLTMLTADTHFTDGYLDKSCDRHFDDAYADSFYCADSMIFKFIEWIKEQDFYDNTTIVIVGDHLTMQDGFYDDDSNRTIYNVFINANVTGQYNNKNRVFTVLDLFPTTIASLGADIEGDRLGLGTNLFSNKSTVPELIGMEEFNNEISKWSHYYYNNIKK